MGKIIDTLNYETAQLQAKLKYNIDIHDDTIIKAKDLNKPIIIEHWEDDIDDGTPTYLPHVLLSNKYALLVTHTFNKEDLTLYRIIDNSIRADYLTEQDMANLICEFLK
jgi:hypothetical protein